MGLSENGVSLAFIFVVLSVIVLAVLRYLFCAAYNFDYRLPKIAPNTEEAIGKLTKKCHEKRK